MLNRKVFLTAAATFAAATMMTAYAEPAEQVINAYFGNYNIIINGADKSDTPDDSRPFIYNDRTYVPLRYIGESLNKQVVWDGDTSTIYINDDDTLSEDTNSQTSEAAKEVSEVDEALEQYRNVISNASSYQYDPYSTSAPVGNYKYALVKMQPENTVPTLLLELETDDGINYMRIFQYNASEKTLYQPTDSLMEGVASTGGYRGSIAMAGDGMGIIEMDASSRGYATFYRVTLNGDTLVKNVEWDGNMFQTDPNIQTTEINLRDISDLSAFNDWSTYGEKTINVYFGNYNIIINGEDKSNAPDDSKPFIYNDRAYVPLRYISELLGNEVTWDGDTSTIYINDEDTATETEIVEEPAEAQLPTDGDRIVLTGTIGTYTYDGVLELQGISDPNPGYSSTKDTPIRLIVLDTPQTLSLRGEEDLISREVTVINVTYADGLEQYEGQHVTFSIDPYYTPWPQDTSLPLGQPGTYDIHILN
jgi:hypothetical protein